VFHGRKTKVYVNHGEFTMSMLYVSMVSPSRATRQGCMLRKLSSFSGTYHRKGMENMSLTSGVENIW
jgi:hypothetical protein